MKSFMRNLLVGLVLGISLPATAAVPKIIKSFNPASIITNEFVTLTIGFINPNPSVAMLTAPFTERLPNGMVILGSASTTCGGTLVAEPGSSKITLTEARIPAYNACQVLVGVTATKAGSFESKTHVAALQTDKGNNTIPTDAVLTVIQPAQMDLRIKKSFNPSTIKRGEFTTLSILLSNPNNEAIKLEAPLNEYLPDGMVILGSSSTTCGGALTAKPGTKKVSLADVKIAAYGSCEILLGVTAPEEESDDSANSAQAELGKSKGTAQATANLSSGE